MKAEIKTFTVEKYDSCKVNSVFGLEDGDYLVVQILSIYVSNEEEGTEVTALMAKKEG